MKKLILVSLFFLIGCTSFYNTKDYSTLRAVTYGIGNSEDVWCTATKIDKNHLLTAAHCVDAIGQNIIVWDNNKIVGTVFVDKISDKTDLALLYIQSGVEGIYAPVASQEALQDEIIANVGYPLGIGEIVSEGLSELLETDEDGNTWLVVKIDITYGNSGGGVFVYRFGHWELVGVASHGWLQPVATPFGTGASIVNHLGAYVSIKDIKDFLIGTNFGEEEEERPLN